MMLVALGVTAWAIAVSSGMKISYLVGPWAVMLRWYILFPVLAGSLIYVCFVHRWKGGSTGYRMRMRELRTAAARRRETAAGIGGLLLIAAGVSWSSIGLTAWGAKISASVPFADTYRVVSVRTKGGPLWGRTYSMSLQRLTDASDWNMTVTNELGDPRTVPSGSLIEVRGRSSPFGRIVSSARTLRTPSRRE